jgi:hypothetical protein
MLASPGEHHQHSCPDWQLCAGEEACLEAFPPGPPELLCAGEGGGGRERNTVELPSRGSSRRPFQSVLSTPTLHPTGLYASPSQSG